MCFLRSFRNNCYTKSLIWSEVFVIVFEIIVTQNHSHEVNYLLMFLKWLSHKITYMKCFVCDCFRNNCDTKSLTWSEVFFRKVSDKCQYYNALYPKPYLSMSITVLEADGHLFRTWCFWYLIPDRYEIRDNWTVIRKFRVAESYVASGVDRLPRDSQ
jgi:hypothetical protein